MLFQQRLGPFSVAPGHGEADILAAVPSNGLEDDVYVDPVLCQEREDLKGDPGLVGQAHQGQPGHIFIFRHTADVGFFHVFYDLLNFRTRIPGEAGENLQIDVVSLGHFHRAVVQHLRPQAGQFQHLVIGDLFQLSRSGDRAGIGGVHAVHIGVDLTQICMEGGGQSHRRGVGAAPSQGSDVIILIDALEAGHQDDLPGVQLSLYAVGADALDPGTAVSGVGEHPRLPASERDHRIPQSFDGHGAQGDGDLFSSGQQHVHLPAGGSGVDLFRLGNQVIGGVPLGGQDHHHVVSFAICLRDDPGHIPDAGRVGDGAAAEFLYDQCHISVSP